MIKTRVVVGVDGSAGSAAAVRWAAEEARMRQAELRVLIARHRRESFALDARQADADADTSTVQTAVQQARAVAPGVSVRGVALPGYAVPVLVHAAEEAALVVLGSHGGRSFFGQAHGSVCSQVATQAQCCVVVVRGGEVPADGPIVVGVNDDPDASTIIGRAFEEAAMRGAPLIAVTVRDGGSSTAEEALGTEIDLQLDPWREKYPQVRATREVIGGKPDKVLLQQCRQAQLVVAGARQQGALLGPVGTRLLQRAECPVLIARA
ncbi:Nucleotide-binding universal stress protein, UspA family [Paractinoplanes atraurantiacus]|uniref:Nucleotide-binding universal stress protein, UspA family n=2 Tax=Paractinoplanes atraurantiacus TaxID=1036182 RepID=A0A285K419_9ACTN|nr:Nucleotide-binding universal stress protein, UspA family [Actinoplanes atraurantiacus]